MFYQVASCVHFHSAHSADWKCGRRRRHQDRRDTWNVSCVWIVQCCVLFSNELLADPSENTLLSTRCKHRLSLSVLCVCVCLSPRQCVCERWVLIKYLIKRMTRHCVSANTVLVIIKPRAGLITSWLVFCRHLTLDPWQRARQISRHHALGKGALKGYSYSLSRLRCHSLKYPPYKLSPGWCELSDGIISASADHPTLG